MRATRAHRWTDGANIYCISYDRGERVHTCEECPDQALYQHGDRLLCWSHAKRLYDLIVRLTGAA